MAVNNSLQTSKTSTFSAYINAPSITTMINSSIGNPKEANNFKTNIISAVSANKDLKECDFGSILSSAFIGHSLNLPPSPQLGYFYMVAYKNRKAGTKSAQFIIGYKGLLQLAMRSGQYKKINVVEIKKGELISRDRINEDFIFNPIEDDVEWEQTETIGYYAMFENVNGFTKKMYMSKEAMEIHADNYSSAFQLDKYRLLSKGKIPENQMWKYSSFWYKNFDEMAKKTMLRRLLSKWGIMSLEIQKAIEEDLKSETSDNFEFTEENIEIQNVEQEEKQEEVFDYDVSVPKDDEIGDLF